MVLDGRVYYLSGLDLRAAAIRCLQRFRRDRQSKSITVRQEYGGLTIRNSGPVWNCTAFCAFLVLVGLSCGLRMRAVPVFSVGA